MKYLTLSDARAQLPTLIETLRGDAEEVVITRHGKAVAKLVRFEEKSALPNRYPLRDLPIKMAADFDEPLAELWESSE